MSCLYALAVVIQLLSRVRRFVTPWTAARQAFLSFTVSWSFLKLMSIESVMPFNHLILLLAFVYALAHPIPQILSVLVHPLCSRYTPCSPYYHTYCVWKDFILFTFCSCGCSVTKLCLTRCDPMNSTMPGFLVLHYLLELAQTHVRWVDDAIQPSHPLSPPSPPALNLSQHPDHLTCHLTLMQVSQEAGKVVCYSHLFKSFPQFVVIHTVKSFSITNEAEVDFFFWIPLLFIWSNRCWQFDLWFLCLF